MRFYGTNVKAGSIKSNFAQINDYRIFHGKSRVKWFDNPRLKIYVKVIEKLFPSKEKSKPVLEKLVNGFKGLISLNNWTQYTFWVASVLAYSFSLRSCEYSETKDYDTPTLAAVSFAKTNSGNNAPKRNIS